MYKYGIIDWMQTSPVTHEGKIFSLLTCRDPLPLRAGEIVSAEVLDAGAGNIATIRLKNASIDVETEISLRTGDIIALRVEKLENAIYLRLPGGAREKGGASESIESSALHGYEKLRPATESMERLINLLSLLPGPIRDKLPEIDIVGRFLLQIDHLSGKTMKDIVENGGLFFETKLRILADGLEADGMTADIEAGRIIAGDLKASLLRLKDIFLTPAVLEHIRSRVSADELLDALNSVLRNIEFFQLLSKLQDSLHFFLPLLWRQLRDGEIIIREYDLGKPGERSHACTVSLELEGAGNIRIHFIHQSGYIHIVCSSDNADFSHILREGAGLLEEQFKISGLRLGHFSVHHDPALDFEAKTAQAGLSILA